MIIMRLKVPILLGILGVQNIFSSPHPNLELCTNRTWVKGPKGLCSQAPNSGNAWHPTCLNSGRPYGHHTRPKPSSFGPLSKNMETLSDRDVWGNSGGNGTMSLSGMPPEFFAALATDSQNSTAPIQSYPFFFIMILPIPH